MGLMRDVALAWRLPRRQLGALCRAVVELALARAQLHADHSHHLLKARSSRRSPIGLTEEQTRRVDQVAFALNSVAPRVPWRADCLVQALAGERWLRRQGITAQVVIGVHMNGQAPLDAHAWLEAGGFIVVGGDIAAFKPLTD